MHFQYSKSITIAFSVVVQLTLAFPLNAIAGDETFSLSKRMHSIVELHVKKISRWIAPSQSTKIVQAVKNQNRKKVPLSEIKKIDKQWIAGKADTLANLLRTNEVGQYLKRKVENSRIYTEAFLCDNQGAIVGEFPKTSDYWQGDEDKFIQSFMVVMA